MPEGAKTVDSSEMLIQTSEEYSARQQNIAGTKGLLRRTPQNLDALSVVSTTAKPTELEALFGSNIKKALLFDAPPFADEKGFFNERSLMPTVTEKKLSEMTSYTNALPQDEKTIKMINMLKAVNNQQANLELIRNGIQEILGV